MTHDSNDLTLVAAIDAIDGFPDTSTWHVSADGEKNPVAEAVERLLARQTARFEACNREAVSLAAANIRMVEALEFLGRLNAADNEVNTPADFFTFVTGGLAALTDLTGAGTALYVSIANDGKLSELFPSGMAQAEAEAFVESPAFREILSIIPSGADLVPTRLSWTGPQSEDLEHPVLAAPLWVDGRCAGSIFLIGEENGEDFNADSMYILTQLVPDLERVLERLRLTHTLEKRNRELQAEKNKQQELIEQLEAAQSQLMQSEKMASVGQLAAGVAHEINNPIGYVYSNLGSLEKYLENLFLILDAYEASEEAIGDDEVLSGLRQTKRQLDLEFLKEDLPMLMNESKEGITRVKKIVQDLKDFSHVDATEEWHFADLEAGIDSTLNVVNNEIKYKAEVRKEYGAIPQVECLSSQVNQVFMNLLVNAAQAMEEKGAITVRTGQQGEEVWVEVEDTGKGITAEHMKKIFDPFFTTKPIGKGTGLGLAVSYGIIHKHRGRIEVASEVGKGTRFRVWLPMTQQATPAAAN